ncbi:unnamed protein product [Symbiodinium microadriaticum]|nr:unnamed protein product [Symbiodinium microadriaticum]
MAPIRVLLVVPTAWARAVPVVPKKAPTKAMAFQQMDHSQRPREVRKTRTLEMETLSPNRATGRRLQVQAGRRKLSKKESYPVSQRSQKIDDAWHC